MKDFPTPVDSLTAKNEFLTVQKGWVEKIIMRNQLFDQKKPPFVKMSLVRPSAVLLRGTWTFNR